MSKKRSNKEQIKFLHRVRTKIILDYSNPHRQLKGLCAYMIFTDINWGPVDVPLFTKENAIKHANAINDPYDPNSYNSPYSSFWWEYHSEDRKQYDLDNRVLFIEWMISELSKKQPNMWQRFIAHMTEKVPIEEITFPG